MKIDILRTHFFRILTSSKGAEDGFPELRSQQLRDVGIKVIFLQNLSVKIPLYRLTFS